jgi:hypothetical protein
MNGLVVTKGFSAASLRFFGAKSAPQPALAVRQGMTFHIKRIDPWGAEENNHPNIAA